MRDSKNTVYQFNAVILRISILGIDLMDAMKLFQDFADLPDVARKCKALEKIIKKYQDSFTAVEKV